MTEEEKEVLDTAINQLETTEKDIIRAVHNVMAVIENVRKEKDQSTA